MLQYAFYSLKHETQGQDVAKFWESPSGELVRLTTVSATRDGAGYVWDDKVFVGEVVKYHSNAPRAEGLPPAEQFKTSEDVWDRPFRRGMVPTENLPPHIRRQYR